MPELAKPDMCTGCATCVNVCPNNAICMKPDQEGFLQPSIDYSKCVNCGLCKKVCPITETQLRNNNNASPKAYAVWHYEDRTKSSSGGAFSALARKVLNDGGYVYGAAWMPFPRVKHIEVNSIEGLTQLRGSKYVQSEIGGCYIKVKKKLEDGKKVLFTGTPCQVAGLKSYLRKPYENLLLVDIACHGTPSGRIFEAYIKKLELRLTKQIKNFEFRRRNGWGFAPSITIDNEKIQPIYSIDNIYMKAFDKAALFRKSCYQCPFARIPRVGDCTIADFWGIGCYGEKFDQDVMKGVSLVLVNNEHGALAFTQMNGCFKQERHLDEALHKNHNLIGPSILHPYRDEIISAFLDENMSLDQIDERYKLVPHTIKNYISEWALRSGMYDFIKRIYNRIR